MKKDALNCWIAWRFMLVPAIASSGFILWWLWPLKEALWLAAGAGVLVFFFFTFIRMAFAISD